MRWVSNDFKGGSSRFYLLDRRYSPRLHLLLRSGVVNRAMGTGLSVGHTTYLIIRYQPTVCVLMLGNALFVSESTVDGSIV